MEQDQRQSASLLFPGVVVATLVAAGYLLNQPALQTARPTDHDRWSQESTGQQDVEARLWQDPFFAVDQHVKEIDAPKLTSDAGRADEDRLVHSPGYLKAKLQRRLEAAETRPVPPRASDSDSNERITANSPAPPMILVVTAPGAPYSEQAERRRRIRYAVLSGLFAVGYVPEDEEHIGFFRPDHLGLCSPNALAVNAPPADARFPKVVPYEFVRADRLTKWDVSKRRWIMLLWLDNEALDEHPLSTIKGIIEEIHPSNGEGIEYQVIGPSTSAALLKLAREARQDSRGATENCIPTSAGGRIPNLRIWSPWASASEKELCIVDLGHKRCSKQTATLEERMDLEVRGGTQLIRLTPDDDGLVDNLLRELRLRGVDPVGAARSYRDNRDTKAGATTEGQVLRMHPIPLESTEEEHRDAFMRVLDLITPRPRLQRHRLLIVSEFDTPYQRSLVQTFRRHVAEGCAGAKTVDEYCFAESGEFNWVYRFSYLRGVDGQVPGAGDADSDRDKKEKRTSRDEEPPERQYNDPVGNGQFDYIRRLADRIEEEERNLERHGQSGFGAIGVLGMDTYDKLTILQALTARFPGRVFFTTGHDARYLHPRESKWARNLVVVSPFGLQLDPKLQRLVPPFRDSYQTAAFFATLIALDPTDSVEKVEYVRQRRRVEGCMTGQGQPKGGCEQQQEDRWLYPVTFEIGRAGAFQFPARGKRNTNSNNCGPWRPSGCTEIQPTPTMEVAQPSATQRVPGGIAVFAGLTMLLALWRLEAPISWRRLVLVGALGLTTVLAIYFWGDVWSYLSERGNGEPAVFLDGISIWPAQLIRLLALVVAVAALVLSHFSLKRNISEIHRKLDWKPESPFCASDSTVKALALPRPVMVGFVPARRIEVLTPKRTACTLRGSATFGDALHLWRCCGAQQDRPWRIVRVLGIAALYFGLGFSLTLVWPVGVPSRGRFAYEINFWVMMISIGAYSLLVGYVLDAFQSCIWFIQSLGNSKPTWPTDLIDATARRLNVSAEHVKEWLTIQVIAQRTEAVGKLIYGPFVVLFIVVLARSSIFEHWVWPVSLLIIIGLSMLMLIYAAVSLRSATEDARRDVLESLKAKQISAQGLKDDEPAKQLALMIEEVRVLRKGAFASYIDQPFLKAPLLLLAGYAGNLVLDYLAVPVR